LFEPSPNGAAIERNHSQEDHHRLIHRINDGARDAWSMISAMEPWRKARTGVPHAIASIITKSNGSGQSIGNKSACARPAYCRP
jgi:hypothetical protein